MRPLHRTSRALAPAAAGAPCKGPLAAAPRAHPRRASARAAASDMAGTTRTHFTRDPGFSFAPLLNGAWQLAGGHGREALEGVQEKMAAHASAGLTTFDTADIYGPSERILGEFQRSWAAAGHAPVQIFTKYVPNIFRERVSPAAVEAAVRKSMAALQVDKLDLVQLHWWDYSIPGMTDTALALADCKAKGLIRHVGTTNMDTAALSAILDAGVEVACNQVQFSLLDRRPLNGMLQLCQSRGIKLFTYGSVAGGLLSDKFLAQPTKNLLGQPKWPPIDLNTSSLKMYHNVAQMFGGMDVWRGQLLPVLRKVADKHGVSIAAVALRWVMQQGDGTGIHPIVGMRTAAHIDDNLAVLRFSLDAADLEAIAAVGPASGGPQGDIYSFERGG